MTCYQPEPDELVSGAAAVAHVPVWPVGDTLVVRVAARDWLRFRRAVDAAVDWKVDALCADLDAAFMEAVNR